MECLLIVNLSKRSKTFKNKKDTLISGTSSQGKNTNRNTLKAYVEEDQTGARFTYAEKEGVTVEGGKERNGWRVIGGRGKMGRSRVGG